MINYVSCQNNTILDNINQYFYAGFGEGHGFQSPPPGPGVLIQYRNLYNAGLQKFVSGRKWPISAI